MTKWVCDYRFDNKTFSIHVELDTEDWKEAKQILDEMGLGLEVVGILLEEFPANIPNI